VDVIIGGAERRLVRVHSFLLRHTATGIAENSASVQRNCTKLYSCVEYVIATIQTTYLDLSGVCVFLRFASSNWFFLSLPQSG